METETKVLVGALLQAGRAAERQRKTRGQVALSTGDGKRRPPYRLLLNARPVRTTVAVAPIPSRPKPERVLTCEANCQCLCHPRPLALGLKRKSSPKLGMEPSAEPKTPW